MTQYLSLPTSLQNVNSSRMITLVDTVGTYATVITANYLGTQQALGHVFYSTDVFWIKYADGQGYFNPAFDSNGIITLSRQIAVGDKRVITVPVNFAGVAGGGQVLIQASSGAQQFHVDDIRMMYSASGLSGGGGDRLLQITDGTTVYNNAGITAALLGTPINTVWGGSGNPLPGTVALNTSTQAGLPLYAKYSGGTADYTAGTVNLQITTRQIA